MATIWRLRRIAVRSGSPDRYSLKEYTGACGARDKKKSAAKAASEVCMSERTENHRVSAHRQAEPAPAKWRIENGKWKMEIRVTAEPNLGSCP
ncbi:MAG: hypothetical protein IT173_02205 [Acidobacteria bacterium]|nr:hypothetical protein [Acidobacteriota bacterium]